METTKKSPSVKKILSIVGNTVLWLFVVFAILITVIVFASNTSNTDDNALSTIGGLAFVTISSDSMEGKDGFKKGSLIFVNTLTDVEKKELEVGDVITFNSMRDLNGDGSGNDINTHRIVEKHEDNGSVFYVTKGDHNPAPDGVYSDTVSGHASSGYVVTGAMVLGKWNGNKMGGVGSFLAFLKTRVGFFVVIILPLIAFFLYELIRFIMVIVSLKGKKTEDEIRQRVMEEILRAQQSGQASAAPADVPAETPAEAPAEEPKAAEEKTEE